MGVLRKLFCLPPRQRKQPKLDPCEELLASASEDSGWIDTTSYPPIESVVPPSEIYDLWMTTASVGEAFIGTIRCMGCKAVTEIVQRWNLKDKKSYNGGLDALAACSLHFNQKKSEKIKYVPFQKGDTFPAKKHMEELKVLSFEKELEDGDRVDARYEKYITTLKCSYCGKCENKYFWTALCQKNEKVGGFKLYVGPVAIPKGYKAKPPAQGTTSRKVVIDDDGWSGKTY